VVDGTGLPITDGVLVTNDESIAAKRALLGDFVARWARAQRWARDHQQSYAALYASTTGLTLETASQVVRHMNYDVVPIDQSTIRDHQQVADRCTSRRGRAVSACPRASLSLTSQIWIERS
jgi:ABC-type nitrate/sulfonate/bicarbonate transport system substrate-binding protein